jgi:glycosyltransferase involved in cell wall biosynthesis
LRPASNTFFDVRLKHRRRNDKMNASGNKRGSMTHGTHPVPVGQPPTPLSDSLKVYAPPRRPIRVMQVLTRLGAGGPPVHVLCLNHEMHRYGFEMLLITGSCAKGELDMEYLVQEETRVQYIPEMQREVSLSSDLVALWRLFRAMKEFRPDIVHTHTAKAGALGRIAARLAGVPACVHTFHGHVLSGYFGPLGSVAVRLCEKLMAHTTDAIIVLSQQQADDICDHFKVAPRRNVRVIPLGLKLAPLVKLPVPTDHMLSVGWLGRFVPIKGVPLLADIIEQALSRMTSIRFIIAGDGPERPQIEAVVARFGRTRVEWLGWCEDVSEVIARCDLLIETSLNEGTPVSLIQGMAARRPFVATPVGGVINLAVGQGQRCGNAVWHDNCVLVPPDPEVFVNVLSSIAADRRILTRMGAAGQDMVLRCHLSEAMLARIADTYSQVLAAKEPTAPGVRHDPVVETVSGASL